MARRKTAALDVPADDQAAIALVADYVDAERQIARAQLVGEQSIDAVKAERDALIAIYAGPNAQRFAALKAWWEAGGKDLAGKKRSAELAGAVLGIRLTPRAVKFAKGVKAEHVIAWLKRVRWSKAPELLRTKVELDKAAIIKCVVDSQGEEDLLANAGVTVVQTDELFIDCTIGEAPIAAPESSKE